MRLPLGVPRVTYPVGVVHGGVSCFGFCVSPPGSPALHVNVGHCPRWRDVFISFWASPLGNLVLWHLSLGVLVVCISPWESRLLACPILGVLLLASFLRSLVYGHLSLGVLFIDISCSKSRALRNL